MTKYFMEHRKIVFLERIFNLSFFNQITTANEVSN
jgi:hypothetical protein